MLCFKRRISQPNYCPVIRKCYSCNHEVTFYRDDSSENPNGCLECDQCHDIVWYDGGEPILSKYINDHDPGDINSINQWKHKIENFVSPCPKCSGQYHHISHRTYGFPRYCPNCGMSQMTEAVRFEKVTSKNKRIQVNYIEFYEEPEGGTNKGSEVL